MHQHEKLNYVEFGTPNIGATKAFLSTFLVGNLSTTALTTRPFLAKVWMADFIRQNKSVKPQTEQHYWCSIALIFTPR